MPLSTAGRASHAFRRGATGYWFLVIVFVLTVSSSAQPLAAGETAPQEIVCLHAEGGEHNEAFCRLLLAHLEPQFGTQYDLRLAARFPGADALTGSVDVLDAIALASEDSSRALIGFAQSDVAFYFRQGGHDLYPTPHRRQHQVVTLARAYPEYLHIYEHGARSPEPGLSTPLHHRRTTYLGALGSGTLITSLNVLSILGGSSAAAPGDAVKSFFWTAPAERPSQETDWIGTLVSGTGNSRITRRLDSDLGRLLSLSSAESRHLRNAFSRFYNTVTIDSYGEPVVMLEIPALMVASRRLPAEIAHSIERFLEQVDEPSEVGLHHLRSLNRGPWGRAIEPHLVEQLYHGMRRYSAERKSDPILSPHRALVERRSDRGEWELLIAAVALAIGTAAGRRALRGFRLHGSLFSLPPVLTGLAAAALCVAWLHLCLFLVWQIEFRSYMRYATDEVSPFIRHGYTELLPMVLHYIASAFSAEKLFPVDRLAQVVWLSIPLLIGLSTVGSLVHVVVPPALGYLKARMEKGDSMNLQDHIIIVNWHPYADHVIRQLRTQDLMAGREDPTIVVLAARAQEISMPLLGPGQAADLPAHNLYALPTDSAEPGTGILQVIGIDGDSGDELFLRSAAPHRARIILVFPNSSHAEPDSASVLTVLKLQSMVDPDRDTRLIVWCEESHNVDIFLDPRFQLTDVCSTEWAWRVICQSTRVAHASNIYRHLLTSSSESNEFYELPLDERSAPIRFRDAQQAFLRFSEEACETVPGLDHVPNSLLLAGFVRADDPRRERIRLNPPSDSVLQAGDVLIFLTYVFNPSISRRLGRYLEGARTEALAS